MIGRGAARLRLNSLENFGDDLILVSQKRFVDPWDDMLSFHRIDVRRDWMLGDSVIASQSAIRVKMLADEGAIRQGAITPAPDARAVVGAIGGDVARVDSDPAGGMRSAFVRGPDASGPPPAPGVNGATAPADPLFAQQWHLARIGNIEKIWEEYTGAGVHVGVYDENIDITHVDLAANHDATRRVSYGGVTPSDGINPSSAGSQSHGTAVAGLIAAPRNGIGVVGVGFGSTFTGVAIFDTTSPYYVNGNTSQQAGLFAVSASLNFDVVNHSWGSQPGYASSQTLNTPGAFWTQVTNAWKYEADNGRGGLGTIVLKAAGNEYRNANASGENTVRQIIDVAAVSNLDQPASYSNHGVNVLVSGLGSEFAQNGGLGIVTTDRTGLAGYNNRASPSTASDYTDDFGGTSAATPIVAGVVTLILEANPGLGWRDVQNILALSATHVGSNIGATVPGTFENGVWQINGADNWNGGGLHFHTNYGYGVVNAYNAVRIAEAWQIFASPAQTSANEMSVTVSTAPGLVIADNCTTSTTFNVTQGLSVENLQLTLYLRHDDFYELRISLTSPDGSVYTLEDGTGSQNTSIGFGSNGLIWTYGINALREQSSIGTWTITINDINPGRTGTLYNVSATFYGRAPSSDDVYHFTDEFAELAALDPSRSIIADTNGGTDWLNCAAIAGDLSIDLSDGAICYLDGAALFSLAAGTVIENVVGGDGDDTLRGNAVVNALYGMRGEDFIVGGDGGDLLDGGAGDDLLFAGSGNDTIIGGEGRDIVYYIDATAGVRVSLAVIGLQNTVGSGIDSLSGIEWLAGSGYKDKLTGGAGNNVINGNDGNDVIYGLGGNNDLYGDNGNDSLLSGRGDDLLDGGNGVDFANYQKAGAGVTVDLSIRFPQNTGGAGTDTLVRIENLIGSDFNDRLTGDDGANTLDGLDGNDTLDGGAGKDRMIGGRGDDVYYVDRRGDTVTELVGEGRDTVFTTVDFDAGDDEIEIIRVDTSVGRSLTASDFDTLLIGNVGLDTLTGGAGQDRLVGGGGVDILTGGGGRDVFAFGEGDSGRKIAAADHITDLSKADRDRIDLRDIDAIAGNGDDAFTFVGTSAFSFAAGQLRYQIVSGQTHIFGDTNGDGKADFALVLDTQVTLVAADFLL